MFSREVRYTGRFVRYRELVILWSQDFLFLVGSLFREVRYTGRFEVRYRGTRHYYNEIRFFYRLVTSEGWLYREIPRHIERFAHVVSSWLVNSGGSLDREVCCTCETEFLISITPWLPQCPLMLRFSVSWFIKYLDNVYVRFVKVCLLFSWVLLD